MKDGFRQCMAWLHTWTGLIVGWVLYFVFVTGTVGYFYTELDRWMRPELPMATPAIAAPHAAVLAQRRLQERAPQAESWTINFQGGRNNPNLTVSWREPRKPGEGRRRGAGNLEALDTQTGEVIGQPPRQTGGGFTLYRMHYQLHYFKYETAVLIVGFCTMIMLVAIITGIVTHKKIFKDFFTFRPAKGQRSWLDAHNVISVAALPFFLMITYSGLVFFMFNYMPAGYAAVYGMGEREQFYAELYPRKEPATPEGSAPLIPLSSVVQSAEAVWGAGQVSRIFVQMPNAVGARVLVFRSEGASVTRSERLDYDGSSGALLDNAETGSAAKDTQDVMLALHEGHFAGPSLRWLYFLSGALGAAMIATGLVLWTVKRRPQPSKADKTSFGHGLVERLNVATIAGLPIGIAVYFHANRLIPAQMPERGDWEVHALFIAWALSFVHAALRPTLRGWLEQLGAAAVLFAALPVLNTLTTDRHLGVTLLHGDWVLAGVDLSMLALAAAFACAALKVQRKRKQVPAMRRAKGKRAAASTEIGQETPA